PLRTSRIARIGIQTRAMIPPIARATKTATPPTDMASMLAPSTPIQYVAAIAAATPTTPIPPLSPDKVILLERREDSTPSCASSTGGLLRRRGATRFASVETGFGSDCQLRHHTSRRGCG